MPGSMASLGAPICFSRSLTMRSSSSRMFLRRPSIFFCTSTTGTSVTMPSAESSRSRIFFSRSSLRLRPQRLHQEVLLGGKLPGLAAVLGGVLQHGVDRLHEALRLLVAGIALARVLLRSGRRGRWRGCQARLWRGASGRWSIAPRRGVASAATTSATATVEIEPRTANMEPAPPRYLPASMRLGFESFSCLDVVIEGPSAVDPGVCRLDKIEQFGVHLPRVGQHQHVGDGGAGPAHAWLLQRAVEGPVAQVEAEPQLGRVQRDGGELARGAQRDVGGLRRDDEAGDGAADLGLQQLVERAVALARRQQLVEVGDLARLGAARGRCGLGSGGRAFASAAGFRWLDAGRSAGRRCCGCAPARRRGRTGMPCARSQSMVSFLSAKRWPRWPPSRSRDRVPCGPRGPPGTPAPPPARREPWRVGPLRTSAACGPCRQDSPRRSAPPDAAPRAGWQARSTATANSGATIASQILPVACASPRKISTSPM